MTQRDNAIHIIDAGGSHELATLELLHRQGYLESMGVEAKRTYVKNGAEAVALLLAGQGDVAMQVGFGPALVAIERGAPLRVVAASNLLTVHAIYSKHAGIRCLRDLQHRTMGVGALGALTHQLAYAALCKHGIDPALVRFVPIGNSANIFQALLAGEIEAGFGETEVFENQAHYGVHALQDAVLWKELPDFPNQASFATQTAIHQKRDVLVRTLAAYAKLYRWLHDPASWHSFAAARAAAEQHAREEESRSQWLFYQHNTPFAEDLALPEPSLAYLQNLNMAMQLQQKILPFSAVADMSLAQEAMKLI